MESLLVVAALLFLGTPVAALYAVFKVLSLKKEVDGLRQDLRSLHRRQRVSQARGAGDARDPERSEAARGVAEARVKPDWDALRTAPDVGAGTLGSSAPGTVADEAVRLEAEPEPDETEVRATPSAPKEAAEKGETAEQEETPETDPPFVSAPLVSEGLDFETLIGSTWLLRIGLGILAIALALFARSVAPELSPAAKVAIAYAGSIGFFALGKYFEERLERFAQPVMAGGLSFGFFVAFASHFVPAMRAVSLPVSIVWMVVSMLAILIAAERWKSQPTAILAIGLGHLSAQVAAGDADLYSLVMIGFLGLTAIALMLRHRWTAIGLVGVAASYGAHLLWILADRQPVSPDQGFWLNLAFLTSYYAIFMIADILWWVRRGEQGEEGELSEADYRSVRAFGPTNLVLYVSVTTFVYVVSGAVVDSIEWYFLTLGSLQGLLAWFYQRVNHRDYVFYPAFGTILWTLGMFGALDALVLDLVLAAQALLLLVAAHRTRLSIFHVLAQASMAVAFVHYMVYPAPAVVTFGLFLGGLGVGSVYLLKACLEEIWHEDGTVREWYVRAPEASGDPAPGAGGVWGRVVAAHTTIAPFLAPAHAVLGGLIVVREGLAYFGAVGPFALFVTAVQLALLGVVVARSGSALLFTLGTLAALGIPLASSLPSMAALLLLGGFAVSATILVMRSGRIDTQRARSVAVHAQVLVVLVLSAAFVAIGGLPRSPIDYFAWTSLALLLLFFQYLFEEIVPRVAGEALPGERPRGSLPAFGTLPFVISLAIAALLIAVTASTIGGAFVAPVGIAAWSLVILGATAPRRSRSLFISGYALLLGGYAFFLPAYSGAVGLGLASELANTAFESIWAGAILWLVPVIVAVGTERGSTGPSGDWLNGASGLALAPYFMSLTLLGAHMAAQLPYGWAYVAPTLLGILVVSQATKWKLPGGVVAAVVAAAIAHAHLLATAVLRPDGPDALVPLLVFVVATLALERLVTTRITEKWDHEMRRHAMLLLVVLSTTTAMAAVYHSELLGSTWATAAWSVVGGTMMAAGFTLKSAVHRRVALAVLGLCVVRVFVVDTVGLSDTARIGAFLVLGLILVGIALLYTKFSEELKSWL